MKFSLYDIVRIKKLRPQEPKLSNNFVEIGQIGLSSGKAFFVKTPIKPDNTKNIFVSENAKTSLIYENYIGHELIVMSVLNSFVEPVYLLDTLDCSNCPELPGSVSIPESLLENTGNREIDSRKLGCISSLLSNKRQETRSIFFRRKSKDDLSAGSLSSLDKIYKTVPVFFPKNSMSIKEIMYNVMEFSRNSLFCWKCGSGCLSQYVTDFKYITKDKRVAVKCRVCKERNYVGVTYDKDNQLTFTLSR